MKLFSLGLVCSILVSASGNPQYQRSFVNANVQGGKINADVYSKQILSNPSPAVTRSIKAALDSSAPTSAATLAYIKSAGADDVCGRAAQVYIEVISQGGTPTEATALAAKFYINDFNNGLKVVPGSACETAQKAFRKASTDGVDPIMAAAQAYMENFSGASSGNACSAAGRDYISALLSGASHDEAGLLAARSFGNQFRKLAAEGKNLKDEACTNAAKAYYASSEKTPRGAAMIAFIEKAFNGFSSSYDPLCWRATDAFLDSYASGKSEDDSNLEAAQELLQEFAKGGASLPTNSPCAVAAKAYVAASPTTTSAPVKAAMNAFLNYLISDRPRQPDEACSDAAESYARAYRNGASEDEAITAAAEGFFSAYRLGRTIAFDSGCVVAAKAYFSALPGTSGSTTGKAMLAFIEAMVGQNNKQVFDPACAEGGQAFWKAYRSNKSELDATLEGALAYIREYKRGTNVAPDSPCLSAARVFAANTDSTSGPLNSALFAFVDEAVLRSSTTPDSVCLAAGEAYIESHLAGDSEAKSREAAGVAYLDAVSSTPDFDPNSPCGVAAKAYIAELS